MNEQTLFAEALERSDPSERAAFLDDACRGDQALRERIERLLLQHKHAGRFLESIPNPLNATIDSVLSEQPGAVVGPYKLLEQIGEGGFGVVFMAEQTSPVRRKVALKILKPGMDTRQIVARFEAERQALALMDHANIARVFDGGTTASGRPFFVMELVKGVPITDYCDRHLLSPRERLELFMTVCHTVQYAHQKGIIHRDLKPSNILVSRHDSTAVVKVIDFGVAKALGQELTEKTLFTGFAQMIGTPLYMSPEQAGMSDLDIDTRSDIYSLGVLLYELLTGATPFTKERFNSAAYDEIRRIIREEEPPKPSSRLSQATETLPSVAASRGLEPRTLRGVVRGELDWIVMKALEKDRNRRYETASAFSMDVQRYLADEPVQACPPSTWYRFKKFTRRHRMPVVAASLVLLSLVVGVAGTSWGLFQAKAAVKRAEEAEDAALAEFRASTDEAIEQLIGSKPGLGPQDRAYLENTLKRWEAFAYRQGDDERSMVIRAEGHTRLGYIWQKLGRPVESRKEHESALNLWKILISEFADKPGRRHVLAQVHINLGLQLSELGERNASKSETEKARDILQSLITQYPDVAEYQRHLATAHNNLGNQHFFLGENEAATMEYTTARDLQTRLVARHDSVPDHQHELAATCNNLGQLLMKMGQYEAARTEIEHALNLERELESKFPETPKFHHELANAHNFLGKLLWRLGERGAARKEYEAARDLRKQLTLKFANVPEFQQNLVSTHIDLGLFLTDIGDRSAAQKEYEAACEIGKVLVDRIPDVPFYQLLLAKAHNNLGLLLAGLGNRDLARRNYEAARDRLKRLVEKYPDVTVYQRDLANTHTNLGMTLGSLGERNAAEKELRTSIDLTSNLSQRFPQDRSYQVELGGSFCNLGIFVHHERQAGESLPWFEQAIATLESAYRADPRDAVARNYLRNSHWRKAMALVALERHADAVRNWDRAAELSPPPESTTFRYNGALARFRAGLIAEAAAEVTVLSKSSQWESGHWVDFACIYAVASGKCEDKKQEYADRAMEMLETAVNKGWKNTAPLMDDARLDCLRHRDDFNKLLKELKAQDKRK